MENKQIINERFNILKVLQEVESVYQSIATQHAIVGDVLFDR